MSILREFLDDDFTTAFAYSGDDLIYIGRAKPGTAKGVSQWQIRKLTYSASKVTDIQFMDGNLLFDGEWDERAGGAYS